jgi:hypothetical protein
VESGAWRSRSDIVEILLLITRKGLNSPLRMVRCGDDSVRNEAASLHYRRFHQHDCTWDTAYDGHDLNHKSHRLNNAITNARELCPWQCRPPRGRRSEGSALTRLTNRR